MKECALNPADMPDVHYILYSVRFTKEFTASFIQQKLGEYLHANYVRHTLFKRGGHTIFKVDKKHKKNAIVLYARVYNIREVKEKELDAADFSIFMLVSKRFHIQEFLITCYGFKRKKEIVRTQIEALGYYGKIPILQHVERCTSCNDPIGETYLFGKPFGEHRCLVCGIDQEMM
jgi:hypothetical protein